MKKLTLLLAILFSITVFSQTSKKVLTSKEQELKAQRYIEYLKKQNRKQDSIYKIGHFSDNSYPTNDSEIMKSIFRKEKLRSVKKDSIYKPDVLYDVSYSANNDSEIMKRIFRKEELRNVKKDSITKSLNERR